MPIKEEDALSSFRGSFVRREIAELIEKHGPLSVEHLADLSGQDVRTIRWGLDGHHPKYCPQLALRKLRVVERSPATARYGFTVEGREIWLKVKPAFRRPRDRR